MKCIKIKENIFWVGEIDWDVRNFHGYLTQRGSTYNSYLIIDKKITLVDGVKASFFDKMLDRLSSIINPSKIDYIISNHVEMDHSGSIPHLMNIAKNATLITSPNGKKGLSAHYKTENWDFKVVKSGEVINIGEKNLKFFLTPMVHWPDNMISYIEEDKLLFSNDAFGQHLSSSERFDDEYSVDIVIDEARKYYANIVLPYSMQVKKVLDCIKDVPIDLIAPSHGLVWRSHVNTIINNYKEWSANKVCRKALIVYDTMWGSTEKIAYGIASAFEDREISVKIINLRQNHISDIMTDLLTTKYICIGSPTLNNNMLPSVAGFLTYLKGLAPKGRIGLVFGSYGWGGQAVDHIADILKNNCGFELLENIKGKYIPDDLFLKEMHKNLTMQIGQ